MKDLNQYVKEILSDLPMKKDEKEEFKEELYSHLQEHINELLVKGFSEDEAIQQAIKAFGNEQKLNWEMRKAIFPLYKVIRYLWNIVFVTAFLCLVSYSVMEYYHPEFENRLPAYSMVMGFFIVALLAGAGEVIYEALNDQFKSKWLANPWVFFLFPSLLFGIIQASSLFKHPEQYQEGLWLDLFAIPLGAFAYLLSRQLFTYFFVNSRQNFKGNKAK